MMSEKSYCLNKAKKAVFQAREELRKVDPSDSDKACLALVDRLTEIAKTYAEIAKAYDNE